MSDPTFHGKINIDLDTCYDLGCDRSSSEMEFEISYAVRRSVCSTKGTAAFAPGWTESFLLDDCPAFCLSVSIKTNSSCMKMAIECARGNETWTLPGLAKATKDRQGEGFKLQKKTHKFSSLTQITSGLQIRPEQRQPDYQLYGCLLYPNWNSVNC